MTSAQRSTETTATPSHGEALEDHCWTIVNCPSAHELLSAPLGQASGQALKCAPVVTAQLLEDKNLQPTRRPVWLIPEPWNGHLDAAPLLFIGQNPAASFAEDYPSQQTRDQLGKAAMLSYFQGRFDAVSPEGPAIKDGTRVRLKGPHPVYARAGNGYLRYAATVAEKILGRTPTAGLDYALTEAVRCKATQVFGVHQVATACAQAYLWTTLTLSGARVLVCLGHIAREALRETLNAHQVPIQQAAEADGVSVWHTDKWTVLVLPHNGARGFKLTDTLPGLGQFQAELRTKLGV